MHGLCLQTRLHSSQLQLKRGSTGRKLESSETRCACGIFQHCSCLGTEMSVSRMDFLLFDEMLTPVTKPSGAGRVSGAGFHVAECCSNALAEWHLLRSFLPDLLSPRAAPASPADDSFAVIIHLIDNFWQSSVLNTVQQGA